MIHKRGKHTNHVIDNSHKTFCFRISITCQTHENKQNIPKEYEELQENIIYLIFVSTSIKSVKVICILKYPRETLDLFVFHSNYFR